MAMTSALRVELSGDMPQSKLDKLRALLGLTKAGRLDDDEDANFGYRYLQRDGSNRIMVNLYRETATEWYVKLTYLSEMPRASAVDQVRLDILSAASQLGLAVDRVWQPEQQPGVAE